MIRVLLADDEPLTVEAMEYMLQKKLGKEIWIDKAYSGKEAIEASINNKPDIVVMDINMPGIDGMEAIRKIKEIYKDIHFLIVTAMEYFDYAVESVKMEEIEEYILKPVKKDVFLQAVERVIQKIEKQKNKRKKELQMEEQMQIVLPMLEKSFIGTICMGESGRDYIGEFCDLFSLTGQKAYIMIMEFGSRDTNGVQNGIGSGVRGTKYYKEYVNLLKRMCSCIIGDIVRNRMVILVYGAFEKDRYQEKGDSMQIALRLLEQADRFCNDASISIGRIHRVEDVKLSYKEAIKARYHYMDYTEDTRIYHIEDIDEEQEDTTDSNELDALTGCMLKGEKERVQMVLHDLFARIRREEKGQGLSRIKNRTLSIIAHVYDEYKKTDSLYIATLEQIIKANSVQELQKICEDYVTNVMQRVFADKEEKTRTVIEQADQYMMEHMAEKITLSEIARHVNLSEYYFSRLYKSVTGKNYSDKLLDYRIERAKTLIRGKEYTVREIAELVGYPDPNYLSKVFKKYTGVTISDYKNGNYEL